jgi:hypothetical protein
MTQSLTSIGRRRPPPCSQTYQSYNTSKQSKPHILTKLFIVAFNGGTHYRPNKSKNSQPHANLLCEIVKTSHFFQDGQAKESLVASSRGAKS